MEALTVAVVFLLGLAFGSFLNVCISRLPLGKSVVAPRSACPSCHAPIRPIDNIPLLSWVLLRGRCRACGASISIRYPIVELASALLIVACYLRFDDRWLLFKFALFAWLNLGLFFTDSEKRMLPDELTLSGLALGLAFSFKTWVSGTAEWFFTPHSVLAISALSFCNAAFGAIVAAGMLYLIGEAYRLTRGREGMGFGDVKLAAMCGAFVGAKLALFIILLGAASAAAFGVTVLVMIYAKRKRRFADRSRARASLRNAASGLPIPFGSFLALSAIFTAFYGTQLLDWYWRLF